MKSINKFALAIGSFLIFSIQVVSQEADRLPSVFQESDLLNEQQVLAMAEANIEKYRKADALIRVTDHQGKALEGIQLQIRQLSQDFLFGALVFDLVSNEDLSDAQVKLFKQRFEELFNLAVFPFYWAGFEPSAGHPRWNRIDPVLEWCLEKGITCKGHPLGWTHEIGIPDYVLALDLEQSDLLLRARIINNVVGFRNRITMWDVVNEPVNTVTWEMAHQDKSKKNRYRSDVPVIQIADWVEQAYKTARDANPDAEYILNEFRQIADPKIRKRFYDLTEELLKRGTPIHGLGLQAHEPREDWFNPVEVWKTLDLFHGFDLPLHITEFIPQSAGAEITGGYKKGTWTPETQAEYTETMYRLWYGHPAVASINWWAFSDQNSWLPGGGFLDENWNPKPAYHVLKKLIKEEWTTEDMQTETDKRGEYQFRGFYGMYEVLVTAKNGTSIPFQIQVSSKGPEIWNLELPGH